MESNYFGDRSNNMGSGGMSQSSSSSSSSRKGKRSGSDKPKQPQRGLGVAQLEKIRLHGQLGSSNTYASPFVNPYSSNYNQDDRSMRMQTVYNSSCSSSLPYSSSFSACSGFPVGNNGVTMGFPDTAKSNIYGDSQSTSVPRWFQGNAGIASHQQFNVVDSGFTTKSFFEQAPTQVPRINNKGERKELLGSSSQDSDTEEIDLELRLSL